MWWITDSILGNAFISFDIHLHHEIDSTAIVRNVNDAVWDTDRLDVQEAFNHKVF